GSDRDVRAGHPNALCGRGGGTEEADGGQRKGSGAAGGARHVRDRLHRSHSPLSLPGQSRGPSSNGVSAVRSSHSSTKNGTSEISVAAEPASSPVQYSGSVAV